MFVDSLSRHRGGILNVGSVLASFTAGPRNGDLLRHQGFRAVLQRGSSTRSFQTGESGVTALCHRTGADRIPGACRHQEDRGLEPAEHLCPRMLRRLAMRRSCRGEGCWLPGLANKLVTLLPRILPRTFFSAPWRVRSLSRRGLRSHHRCRAYKPLANPFVTVLKLSAVCKIFGLQIRSLASALPPRSSIARIMTRPVLIAAASGAVDARPRRPPHFRPAASRWTFVARGVGDPLPETLAMHSGACHFRRPR